MNIMNPILIRKATAEDAHAISKVLHESFAEFKQFYTDEAFAATTVAKEEVLQRMKEGNVWVAIRDNNVIGTVAVVQKEDALYIRGMAVLPEGRGSKIGWKLLEIIEQYAVENKFKKLLLSTTPYLPSALKLYEKFGFKKVGQMDNSFYGTLIFRMVKAL